MDHQQQIIGQFVIAFGKGVGPLRVQRGALRTLQAVAHATITPIPEGAWPELASQLLERIEAVGRMASQQARAVGATSIDAALTRRCVEAVQRSSMTDACVPPDDDDDFPFPLPFRGADAGADAGADIFAQFLLAFGKGVGPLRVRRGAVVALHERYEPMIRARMRSNWEDIAPQVLERVEAIGRMVADEAIRRGLTLVGAEAVERCAPIVERLSATSVCDGGGPRPDDDDDDPPWPYPWETSPTGEADLARTL